MSGLQIREEGFSCQGSKLERRGPRVRGLN